MFNINFIMEVIENIQKRVGWKIITAVPRKQFYCYRSDIIMETHFRYGKGIHTSFKNGRIIFIVTSFESTIW